MKIEAGGLKFELTDVPAVRRLDCLGAAWDEVAGDSQADIDRALDSLCILGTDATVVLSYGALAAAWLDPVRQASKLDCSPLAHYWGVGLVEETPKVPDDFVVVINGLPDGPEITLADVFVILNVRQGRRE